jgi:Arc/MetJ-type ribon-helix-helix transcriptional regulator
MTGEDKMKGLKCITFRMTSEMHNQISAVCATKDIPNMSETIRDLLVEALAARSKKNGD